MKVYFNEIIFLAYIMPKEYFSFIFGIDLWTNLHNILDLDSCKHSLCIVPALQSFKIGGPYSVDLRRTVFTLN
jgi:hypothetical protein